MTTEITLSSQAEKLEKQVKSLKELKQKAITVTRKVNEFLQKADDFRISEETLNNL